MITLLCEKFDIGILYNHGLVVNHRYILKVFINPFLRLFGYNIGTLLSLVNKKQSLGKILLLVCEKQRNFDFFSHNESDFIERKRIFI